MAAKYTVCATLPLLCFPFSRAEVDRSIINLHEGSFCELFHALLFPAVLNCGRGICDFGAVSKSRQPLRCILSKLLRNILTLCVSSGCSPPHTSQTHRSFTFAGAVFHDTGEMGLSSYPMPIDINVQRFLRFVTLFFRHLYQLKSSKTRPEIISV